MGHMCSLDFVITYLYHLVEFPLIGDCHLVWQICDQLGSDDIAQPECKFPDNMYKVWLRTDLE